MRFKRVHGICAAVLVGAASLSLKQGASAQESAMVPPRRTYAASLVSAEAVIRIRDVGLELLRSVKRKPTPSLPLGRTRRPPDQFRERGAVCAGNREWTTATPLLPEERILPSGERFLLRESSDSVTAGPVVAIPAKFPDSSRDHGIVTLHNGMFAEVVRGCLSGGCGDPTPVGGRFRLIQVGGSSLPPSVTSDGDIAFLASLENAPAKSGAFIFRRTTRTIEPILLEGKEIPGIGVVESVGLGQANDRGSVGVVFSTRAAPSQIHVSEWRHGELIHRLSPGSPVSDGGVLDFIAYREFTFVDETKAFALVPALNDSGAIAILGLTSEGNAGIIVQHKTEEILQLVLTAGDPIEDWGTADAIFYPQINARGEYAAFVDSISTNTSGWIVGTPGNPRVVLRRLQQIGDTIVSMHTLSAPPYRILSECGDLLVTYTSIQGESERDVIVVVPHAGPPQIISGREFVGLNLWPDASSRGAVTFGGIFHEGNEYFSSLFRSAPVSFPRVP